MNIIKFLQKPTANVKNTTKREISVNLAERVKGIKQLGTAQANLQQVKLSYKMGTYSGHPEETLEEIEFLGRQVNQLKALKANNWVPTAKVTAEMEATAESLEELVKVNSPAAQEQHSKHGLSI